jgi:hypothetical protein
MELFRPLGANSVQSADTDIVDIQCVVFPNPVGSSRWFVTAFLVTFVWYRRVLFLLFLEPKSKSVLTSCYDQAVSSECRGLLPIIMPKALAVPRLFVLPKSY